MAAKCVEKLIEQLNASKQPDGELLTNIVVHFKERTYDKLYGTYLKRLIYSNIEPS